MINKYNRINFSHNNRNKAFTLVEVMVAILLTTVVLTAAYMVWSKIRLGISRSHTRQTLQNELRKAANYIQNDFKSIKFAEEGDEEALTYSSSNTGFSMSFKKFKETKEGGNNKLAQDNIESVHYSLNGNVLTRKGEKTVILSSHCDSVSLERTKETETGLGDKFVDARNAKLDIEISGKMKVPGTSEEMYHVEKTSVVMRNEYYKVINKNYKSNFDLQEMEKNDVVKKGSEADIDLSSMSKEALEGMLENQETVIKQCEDNLKDINTTIAGETPSGVAWYSKVYAFFGGDNMYGQFTNEQEALEKAETIDQVNAAVKEIQQSVNDQETDFLTKSYSGYSSLGDKDKKEVKKMYDMAVHDKILMDSYEALEDKSGSDKPITYKEQLEYKAQGKIIVQGKNANGETVNTVVEADKNDPREMEEARKQLEIYEKISLTWMDDSEYESDIGIYKSRKNLLESANTKIELIKVKDDSIKGKKEIQDALANK